MHDDLNGVFFEHQEAVLERDFARARERLVAYRSRLLEHMKDEEEALLPVYEREPPPPNGKVEFFVHEHRQMLGFLDEIKGLLDAARDSGGAAREVLALLDKETQYKNFTEHHEMREERWLFPALDRIATGEERAELLARCLR